MRVWIDIDNPPQARYLAPFAAAFARHGDEVMVTARDTGITHELLKQAAVSFLGVGGPFGASRRQKISHALVRAAALVRCVRRAGGAQMLLASSRSSAAAAWAVKVPAFVVCDYEHVELTSYRVARVNLLFPDVIARGEFLQQGFSPKRLISFPGLKEDITFSGGRLLGMPPPELEVQNGMTRVLVRPPAEDSHYFTPRSRVLFDKALATLAGRDDVQVVMTPRQPDQVARLRTIRWLNDPVILRRAVPILSLLSAVDWVVCGGGTMLREAAYLGIPAIGVFQGPIGAVDRYLASLGAVTLVKDIDGFQRIDLSNAARRPLVSHHADLLDRLTRYLRRRVGGDAGAGIQDLNAV